MLIVDDEEALAAAMARTLLSRGIESDVALSAAEARAYFQARDYALVLLDVKLPDESGYGLLEELRSGRPDTAVVMITGVDDPELGRAALDHGAYGYVIKPVGATQLYLLAVTSLRRRAEGRRGLPRSTTTFADLLAGLAGSEARINAVVDGGSIVSGVLRDVGTDVLVVTAEPGGDHVYLLLSAVSEVWSMSMTSSSW